MKTSNEYSSEYAQGRLRTNAADLRTLADKFDRIAAELDQVPSPGRARHVDVAVQAIHEHATWLANAHLESAVRYAAEADIYAAAERAGRV